jgi:hypothetical protein
MDSEGFLQHPGAMDSEGFFFRNHVQWTMKDFFTAVPRCIDSEGFAQHPGAIDYEGFLHSSTQVHGL